MPKPAWDSFVYGGTVPPDSNADERFVAAAFGPTPGISLPAPSDAYEAWLRAVALGGQGHYHRSRAQLLEARRATADPALVSLTYSTEASLSRQLGWHVCAARLDGSALARFPELPREAAADALVGLAADALGVGRLDLGQRLLERCREMSFAPNPDPHAADFRWRAPIRWCWVAAELALAHGDTTAALHFADEAARRADTCPSVRHAVKSTLLSAAATAASGDLVRAAAATADVERRCVRHSLVPLRWAAAMLSSGLGDPERNVAADCRRVIERRGGRFRR